MKPETKDDIRLHDELKNLEKYNKAEFRKQVREDKRKIKRKIAKNRRIRGKNELAAALDDICNKGLEQLSRNAEKLGKGLMDN